MFHLSAYTGLLGTVALTDIPALSDDIVPISNNHFLPYQDYMLIAAYAASATLLRAQINSGTIRQVNPTYIRPINVGTLPANNPNLQWFGSNPFRVHGQEELQMLATSGIAMGTEQFTGLVFFQTSPTPAPIGDVYFMRFTSTTAAVANKWTTIPYTLDTGLPAGRYAIVGSDLQSTNAIAHRWIFDNQVERPGTLSVTALGNRNPYLIREGQLGLFGFFYTYSLPRLQVLVNGADAAHEGYMKVVKVA